MENFFTRMESWRKPEGALHLYVLPGDDELDRFVAAQTSIEGIDHLPPMPRAYLHCTLQRLAEFDDEVSQADLTRLGSAVGAALSDISAFDLVFGQPRAGEVAVEVWAEPSQGWDDLLSACRGAVREAWGSEVPSPPIAPHLSLAYANGPVAQDAVVHRLATVENLGTVRVDRVHLVSVTMRPKRGTFDFTALANWDLAPIDG